MSDRLKEIEARLEEFLGQPIAKTDSVAVDQQADIRYLLERVRELELCCAKRGPECNKQSKSIKP